MLNYAVLDILRGYTHNVDEETLRWCATDVDSSASVMNRINTLDEDLGVGSVDENADIYALESDLSTVFGENNNVIGKHVPLLDKGGITLIDMMPHPYQGVDNQNLADMAVVSAARVSYLGKSKGPERDRKLLNYLVKNHHDSPLEMVQFKFIVKAPLFVARQWMRHRTASYNEVSRRYTSESIEFYVPDEIRAQATTNKQASDGQLDDNTSDVVRWAFVKDTQASLNVYRIMLEAGVSREMARMVLPQNMYTTFMVSVNLRNLLHFVDLRADNHAQYEIRVYAQAIRDEYLAICAPWTIDAFRKHRWNQ